MQIQRIHVPLQFSRNTPKSNEQAPIALIEASRKESRIFNDSLCLLLQAPKPTTSTQQVPVAAFKAKPGYAASNPTGPFVSASVATSTVPNQPLFIDVITPDKQTGLKPQVVIHANNGGGRLTLQGSTVSNAVGFTKHLSRRGENVLRLACQLLA